MPTPRPHRGIPTQASSRIGWSAISAATSPTQPITEVNTEPMEVSRVDTVTAGGVEVQIAPFVNDF